MKKYRMLLHYKGTDYAGWQKQPNKKTVQGELEQAVNKICGKRCSVIGSGRTDAGVHARGQVAHFMLGESRETKSLQISLNAVLPSDIRIMNLKRTRALFHAQRDASRKRYAYRIYNGSVLSPFLSDYVLHYRAKLDWDQMRKASQILVGRHDFSGFTSSRCRVSSKVRTVIRSEILRSGYFLWYRIEGDGFLHHMVRNIVGTLLEIGICKRDSQDPHNIIRNRDRSLAGPTAPAHALCLDRVWY